MIECYKFIALEIIKRKIYRFTWRDETPYCVSLRSNREMDGQFQATSSKEHCHFSGEGNLNDSTFGQRDAY